MRSWDGVEQSDMIGRDKKGAGGLRPQGAGRVWQIAAQRLRKEHEQERQPPAGWAQKKKNRVPRAWPW